MTRTSRHGRRAGAALVAICAFAAAALLAPGAGVAQTINVRIGNCTINDAVHEHIKILKDELEKQSNGRLKADLFINCQLGTIPRQIEGVQLGTQDFFSVPPGFAVGAEPRYQVVDAPGLFDSHEHAHKAITHPVFYDKYMQLGRDKSMTPVSLWQAGRASYLTLTPFRTVDDFKGRKIRVLATKLETELMARAGASGVPITFTDIVPSLMSKMIDGARTAPLVMASAKMYTAAKYMTLVNDSYIPIMTWVSNRFLDKLPAEMKALVFKVGRDIEPRMLPIAMAEHDTALKTLKENGVEIIQLPDAQQKAWMQRARAVSDEFLGADPNTKELYAALKEAAEKTRN